LEGGLFSDIKMKRHNSTIRDCDLEIGSPYNRSKDIFMNEGEEKTDGRPSHKLSTDINSSSLSQMHSPYKPFFNLIAT